MSSEVKNSVDWIREISIVDSHVHYTNRERVHIGWLGHHATLSQNGRDWTREDHAKECSDFKVEHVVFAEVDVDPDFAQEEAKWMCELYDADLKSKGPRAVPRLSGIVCHAPLHLGGAAVRKYLDTIKHPGLKGVRRLVQTEANHDLSVSDSFVEGVKALADYGLACDMGVKHWNLASVIQLAKKVPDVTFVIDHIGKPDIAQYARVSHSPKKQKHKEEVKIDPFSYEVWADHIKALAALPNVYCKISGVVTEADFHSWTLEQISPFILHCLHSFGYERCLFGSDWFVSTQATSFTRWITSVAQIVTDDKATKEQRNALFRNTAVKAYKLQI